MPSTYSSNCRTLIALAATSTMLLIGCGDSNASSSSNTTTPGNAERAVAQHQTFEDEGPLGGKQTVLVLPVLESQAARRLRARRLGVSADSIKPAAYGIEIYRVFSMPSVGTAVCMYERIYHLDSFPDQVSIDTTYFHCDGLASPTDLKISERRHSEQRKADADAIALFLLMAERVMCGADHRAAYDSLQPGGSLAQSLRSINREDVSTREFGWIAGIQRIERIDVEIVPSSDYGNQLKTRFVRHHGPGGE